MIRTQEFVSFALVFQSLCNLPLPAELDTHLELTAHYCWSKATEFKLSHGKNLFNSLQRTVL